jgi:hypothetical protein
MKKMLLLAAVFVSSLSAMAQAKTDELIKVSADQYSFGKIKQGVPVTTFFTITNVSNKPVAIENAFAGCGCTTPEYSKAPVAAGATTRLKVGYNAAALGTFTKDVTIKLAGTQDTKIVKITGEVLDAAAWDAYTQTDEFKKEQKQRSAQEAKDAKAAAREGKKEAKQARKAAK